MCISVCADAVRGRYHEINGTPCQDRYSVYRVEGVVCAALCDGAGSCEFSHFGAEAVSREIAKFLASHFFDFIDMHSADAALRIAEVSKDALQGIDIPPEELACTLVFAATDAVRYFCGNIGDGRIFLSERQTALLLNSRNGNTASETYFITDNDARYNIEFRNGALGEHFMFLLTTDGAGTLLYDNRERRPAPAIDIIRGWCGTMDSYGLERAIHENLEEVFSEATQDDVSMVLIYR